MQIIKRKTLRYMILIQYLMAIGFALLSISPLYEKAVYEALKNTIVFAESGSGADIFLTDKTHIFSETGSGLDQFLASKLREFTDTGTGLDKFLKDWMASFGDSGQGFDTYWLCWPYPLNLKAIIIKIRDKV